MPTKIPCDGDKTCTRPLTRICRCGRCEREGDVASERFHTCESHLVEATDKHARLRGRIAEWHRMSH